MSDEEIIRYCAPTLAGIKAGSMFACRYDDRRDLVDEICRLNRRLSSKGLRVIPLSFKDHRALIYFYRPCMLEERLDDTKACSLLESRGYPCRNTNGCLWRLMEQLEKSGAFPHEIGLFLGYPAEDVEGFIRNKSRNSKCTGAWKVYGDKDRSARMFDAFKKCTECYFRCLEKGMSIDELTVVQH